MEELGAAGEHLARSEILAKREDGSCSGRVRVLVPHHSDASTADTAHDDRFGLDMHPGDDDVVPRGGGAIAAGSRRLRCKTAPHDAGYDDGGFDTTGVALEVGAAATGRALLATEAFDIALREHPGCEEEGDTRLAANGLHSRISSRRPLA